MVALLHSSGSHTVEESARCDGSLEPTPLLAGSGGKWCVTLYPEAGEATIVALTKAPAPDRHAPPANDADRRRRNAEAHAQRAASKVRRYAKANRLAYLWTLTFAEPVRSLAEAGRCWDAFAGRLREKTKAFPWLAVFEPHPGGHGYHIHFGTDRFLSVELIRKLWGQGHVWIGDPGKMPMRNNPRKLATYLAKYVGKNFRDDPRPAEWGSPADAGAELVQGVIPRARGQHRYRLAQGFDPQVVKRYFHEADRAYFWVVWYYGQPIDGGTLCLVVEGRVDGWWLEFPDKLLAPPPITRAAA